MSSRPLIDFAGRNGPARPSRGRCGPSSSGGLAVTFLYKSAAGGLRMTSLSKDSIQGMTVMRPGVSPIVIFFSQSP